MSEQVKRYSVDCPLAYPPLDGEREVVLAADYDALHAEAEALRAENERLRSDNAKFQHMLADITVRHFAGNIEDSKAQRRMDEYLSEGIRLLEQERDQLRAELEAARGLLAGLRVSINLDDTEYGYTRAEKSELIGRIDAFLTARPAPEVPDHLSDSAKMVEQGDRQDAVAWGAFHFGGKRNGKLYAHCETQEQIESYIADLHRSNDSITLRKGPLYTTPQPGQDVRGLVETLEQIIRKADDRTAMTDADYRTLSSVVAEEALAAHRQAQQGGSHDR